MLKDLIKQRLMAAADEIFALFERTLESYEEELSRRREEKVRRQLHEAACTNDVVQPLFGRQEERPPQPHRGSSTLTWEDPQPPYIKEEEEEVWTTQERECLLSLKEADLTELPLTGFSLKTEDEEGEPREDQPLAPLSESDHTTSHSPEDEDGDDDQEPLSGDMRTHTDNKHCKCSKKKTGQKCVDCSESSFSAEAKPFSCSVCRKSFAKNSHLNEHAKTHTGERPFNCSVCAKRFTNKSHLNEHVRTHTGEKPFCCSVCVKSFAKKSNLNDPYENAHRRKVFRLFRVWRSLLAKSNPGEPHGDTHGR
ncbi:zinc finger protein 26-like [Nerophis ophidion]|uniref:zinc finger protein 26-like n=1 Tax=Nerophis ophidion TaxID=159077 RepID=UPI002AE07D45|nr:zinc finger protein 26-like [Nerophis ophidion]